jgi:hypothetical protein
VLGYLTTFRTAKAGAADQECEDAAACRPVPGGSGEFRGRRLAVAVADGASEAMLAGQWARSLVDHFVSAPFTMDLLDVIEQASAQWVHHITRYRVERDQSSRPIAWYEEPGLERGSYATIVAARLTDRSHPAGQCGRIEVWALGDACFFQVRDEQLVIAFPLSDAESFNTSPSLVPSRHIDRELLLKHVNVYRGSWESGDTIYLATDALALWFLDQHTAGERPWEMLRDLGTRDSDDFEMWVAGQRVGGRLKNDDTTLLRIDL